MKFILIVFACLALYVGLQISPTNNVHPAYPIVKGEVVAVNSTPVITTSFARTIKHNEGICINNRTHADYTNILVSKEEVYFYASKYWSGDNLNIAVALTVPEGQRDLNCIGDELAPYYNQRTNDGRHYGESIGLYQYRTIIEQTNKGGCEDINWQAGDIERQTGCAFQKWDVSNSFRPWSAFTSKRYLSSL